MSAASCARRRSRRRAPSAKRATSPPPSSRRSRTARSRRSSRSRRRSACSLRPTASSAAPGGTSTSSACSTGVEVYETDQGIQFRGVQTKAQGLRIVGKVGFSDHPMLEHFKFLKAHAKVTPKMTIPAPPVLHFRLAKDGIKQGRLSRSRPILRRSRQAYKQGGQGVLRRRLPLSAVRRHGLGLSLLAGGAAQGARARCRTSTSCRTSMRA